MVRHDNTNGSVHRAIDKLTYWLMRTMAISSRSVRRLNASSIDWVGVSSEEKNNR